MKSLFLILLLSSIVAACQPAPPVVDLEAAKKELMDADKAWSETTKSADRFASFFADDGSLYPPNAPVQTGREAIAAFMTQFLSTPGIAAEWKANGVEVASSGDMGYTTGTVTITVNDPAGNPVTDTQKYVTVWRKGADGSWKVVADIGNSNNPPPATAPVQSP